MGVPVIAKLGNSLPSRLSGAILSALGLTDWIAKDAEDYVALAVRKASDLGEIAVLRKQLRQTIAASPAGNPILYTQAVEEAYRAMWRQWCSGQ
jgi:predicted O-linked N-acetylglucosamine transferase (SPINDLY family)